MKGMLAVMKKLSDFTFYLYNFDINVSTPMINLLERCLNINFTYGALMFTIIVIFFAISTIVINQMMMTDVEERTYEFAMLRTLGFNNSSFIALIMIQTLIYAIPATIMGFVLLFIFNAGARILLFVFLDISVEMTVLPKTIYLGIMVGIGMPLLSNYFPIRSAMSHTLRDSLDQSRSGLD